MNPEADRDEWRGPYGTAQLCPLLDDLDVDRRPLIAAHVVQWLLTAPQAHPWWSQYSLSVVRLGDYPGVPEPKLDFPGATHELLVVALQPDEGPFTVARMQEFQRDGRMPFLLPVNIAEQFEASDDEMLELASMCAMGVTQGALWPETGDAPDRVRRQWLGSMVRTLAHIRGEAHAG